MQQNQCKATSSRSANSDEQIKGWILLLLHHEPQDKIKSFTDTRERISGRGTKLFDIRKVFSTRWDRLSRQPGKMSRTGKKNFDIRQVFSTRWDCQFGSLPVFFCGTLLGVGSLDPLQGVRCDPQHGALGGRLRGFTAARLKCVKKNFLGPDFFFPSLPADRPLAIENKTLWPPKSFSSQAQACNRTNARLPRRGRLTANSDGQIKGWPRQFLQPASLPRLSLL